MCVSSLSSTYSLLDWASGWLIPLLSPGSCVLFNFSRPSVHDPEPLYSLCSACLSAFRHLCQIAVARVVRWGSALALARLSYIHNKRHSHLGSVPSVINTLQHLSSSSVCCLPLLPPCVVLCEDSRETQPHFPSYFPGKPEWKDPTNLFFLLPHHSP